MDRFEMPAFLVEQAPISDAQYTPEDLDEESYALVRMPTTEECKSFETNIVKLLRHSTELNQSSAIEMILRQQIMALRKGARDEF